MESFNQIDLFSTNEVLKTKFDDTNINSNSINASRELKYLEGKAMNDLAKKKSFKL